MATVDNYGNECADLRAEVEALRAERDDLIRLANGIIRATATPDALPRTIAERDVALDQLAALRAQVPPADVVEAMRWMSAGFSEDGHFAVCNINGADLEDYEVAEWQTALQGIEAWLSTLPTPEAQP